MCFFGEKVSQWLKSEKRHNSGPKFPFFKRFWKTPKSLSVIFSSKNRQKLTIMAFFGPFLTFFDDFLAVFEKIRKRGRLRLFLENFNKIGDFGSQNILDFWRFWGFFRILKISEILDFGFWILGFSDFGIFRDFQNSEIFSDFEIF